MAYIYDPSQQISQSLGKAAKGVGNIFAQVIAQKQQDFNVAQEAEANIQALKKDLNMFSRESISNKSNELLDETRSSIFKNGKLDYSKLKEIRNKITDIADLKQGYEVANQEFERRLQLGIANKDEMLSFTNFYSDLSKVMSNEDLIKRPQDLSNAMNTAYYKNLDANKVSRKVLGSQLGGVQKMGGTVMTKDKDGKDVEVKYAAESYAKFKYNPTTNQMEADPNTNWDEIAANIESQNPEYMKMLEIQFGAGTSFMSKGELVKRMALQSAGTPVYDVTKSAIDIEKESLSIENLRQTIFQNKALFPLKLKEANLSIEAKQAELKRIQNTGLLNNYTPNQLGIDTSDNTFYLPKPQKIIYKNPKGEELDAVVSGYRMKDGKRFAIIHLKGFSQDVSGGLIISGAGTEQPLTERIETQINSKFNSLDDKNETRLLYAAGLNMFNLLPNKPSNTNTWDGVIRGYKDVPEPVKQPVKANPNSIPVSEWR